MNLNRLEKRPKLDEVHTRWPENGHVEIFHNRLRDECLNQEVFLSVTEARVVIEEWRSFYNRVHPHSRLGFQSPDEFATSVAQLKPIPGT